MRSGGRSRSLSSGPDLGRRVSPSLNVEITKHTIGDASGQRSSQRKPKTRAGRRKEGISHFPSADKPGTRQGPASLPDSKASEERSFMSTINSRVARYNFNKKELAAYLDFVSLVSTFNKDVMVELVLEDVMADAQEMRKARNSQN